MTTHISMWVLLDAPLLIGCDMTKMDPFTLSLLSNDEVLDVNQDPLGKQASRILRDGEFEVWAKDLADGSKAVGIFNRSELESPYTLQFRDLQLSGPLQVRDLWRQKNLGTPYTVGAPAGSDAKATAPTQSFTAPIPRHGVLLLKLTPAR